MTNGRHAVIAELTASDHDGAALLLDLCNRFDGLDLPIFLDPDADSTSGTNSTAFAVLEHGAPIGFAWLPDDPAPEACLMVHPDYRRQGIGRALLAAIRTEARRRDLPGFLLVGDQASESGRAFLAAAG